ncbi:MAG TPA: Ser-Thr-rich GPI-anchored membrane family protein, partial [Ignavibacteriaceae bacterium]|nr:Ser-Thr-rich GPI-anchored membrane family protein [Ignavibacteriaceae bacterium]
MIKFLLFLYFIFGSPLTVLFAQQITVIVPNGGEVWQNSTPYGITWTDDIIGSVKIELFKSGSLYSVISAATESDGYFLWMPNVAESGNDFMIKITSVANSNVFDFSDANFSVNKSQLTITSPNGGENLQTSSYYGIVWADNIAGPVKLELYKGGVFYSTVVDTTQSDGYYLWSVNAAESGNDYKIKITSLASSNDFDFSDNDFSITQSVITLISPNGGENWTTSNVYGIVWNDNISGPVKLELYKGGVFYSAIADTTPSDGYYAWTVNAADSGNDYRIKIISLASGNDFDFSDTDFTITKSEITISSPNGGEIWQTSSSYGIVWSDDIFSPVKIELYKGGIYYSTIADTTQSDGYYAWSVNAADSGNDYRVKITSLGSSNDFDYSDNDFTITKSQVIVSSPNGGE